MSSRFWRLSFAIALFVSAAVSSSHAYVFNGYTWPAGSTVNIQLGITGPTSGHLQDGFANYNASAADALSLWNQHLDLIKFSWNFTSVPGAQHDGINQAFFSKTIYGQSFGTNVIAVTAYYYIGSIYTQADTLFNSNELWNSYRGALQYNKSKKKYTYDLHRVALHEFGHTLGLNHPDEAGQTVVAIMNSHTSDLDHLTDDDIAGVQALYGLRITSSLSPPATLVQNPFSYQITANNHPTSFGATGLPPGLSCDASSGLISGAPVTSGTFSFVVSATGLGGTATATVTLLVDGPQITSSLYPPPAGVGSSYKYQITASSPPTSFDASSLPPGLSINKVTGLISGVPSAAGTYVVSVTAYTNDGSASANVRIVITPPQITSSLSPAPVQVGEFFAYQITADGHPTSFDASGLPAGLQINRSTGIISGTPTEVGNFGVTAIAHGSYGDASAIVYLQITPPQITSGYRYEVFTGDQFSYQITATNKPTHFAASSLPPGLSIDPQTGIISGTPSISGFYNLAITASGTGGDATGTVTLVISLPPDPIFAQFKFAAWPMIADDTRPRLYFATSGGVAIFEVDSLSVLQIISSDSFIPDIELSFDRTTLWMPNFQPTKLVAYNLVTSSITYDFDLPAAVDRAFEGVGKKLYLNSSYGVEQLDLNTGATTYFSPNPNGSFGDCLIQISSDGKSLFAADRTDNPSFLAKYDISGPSPIALQRVSQPDYGVELVLDPSAKRLCYITDDYSGQHYKIPERSTADFNTSFGVLNPDDTAHLGHIAYSADGTMLFRHIFKDGGIAGEIDVLDAATMRRLRSISLPSWASVAKMVVDRDNRYLFIGSPDPLYYPDSVGLIVYELKPPSSNVDVPAKSLLNVSTRVMVGTDASVEIGGFIVKGTLSKKVVVRAVATSLTQQGVPGALADPVLELHDGSGAIVAANDNWNSHRQEVLATGLSPADEHESVVIATLKPGGYSAILRGLNNATGVALVEVFDIDPQNSKLANISTRGNVGTGDNVMIGGFIIGGGQPTRVVVRALGPSLAGLGVSNSLADPTLELHDGNGAVIYQNDNWKSDQQSAIQTTGLPPTQDGESAIVATLNPGAYSAIVRGKNNTTGIALVEVFNLDSN